MTNVRRCAVLATLKTRSLFSSGHRKSRKHHFNGKGAMRRNYRRAYWDMSYTERVVSALEWDCMVHGRKLKEKRAEKPRIYFTSCEVCGRNMPSTEVVPCSVAGCGIYMCMKDGHCTGSVTGQETVALSRIHCAIVRNGRPLCSAHAHEECPPK